jgi:hypothetical protein
MLNQRLFSQEEDFRVQNQTLMLEITNLIAENESGKNRDEVSGTGLYFMGYPISMDFLKHRQVLPCPTSLPLYSLKAATSEMASWPFHGWLPGGRAACSRLNTPCPTDLF